MLESTYQIFAQDGNGLNYAASGFIIGEDENHVYLATAGHPFFNYDSRHDRGMAIQGFSRPFKPNPDSDLTVARYIYDRNQDVAVLQLRKGQAPTPKPLPLDPNFSPKWEGTQAMLVAYPYDLTTANHHFPQVEPITIVQPHLGDLSYPGRLTALGKSGRGASGGLQITPISHAIELMERLKTTNLPTSPQTAPLIRK
ncbi:MAG: hypothetical protein UY21_C0014G0025 [Microgenomates group bacterium GW2011_GWA1_48_10]|nr:MAG: hypothetical protein UY21_C0014G0025 [Microgenomates group bacterium GW2011_GWA1_48_10]